MKILNNKEQRSLKEFADDLLEGADREYVDKLLRYNTFVLYSFHYVVNSSTDKKIPGFKDYLNLTEENPCSDYRGILQNYWKTKLS